MDCSTPGLPLKSPPPGACSIESIELVMPSNHLILCCPLLLLPSIFPSIKVFSNESVLRIRWPKYWSFSFSIVLPMNIQDWFLLGLTGLISLQSKGLSRVLSSTTIQKHHFFWLYQFLSTWNWGLNFKLELLKCLLSWPNLGFWHQLEITSDWELI